MSFYAVAHRAMADVRAMKEVFASSKLEPLLARLTLRSKSEIYKSWSSKNNERTISQQLIGRLGKDCTKKMAIRLHEDGITYDSLQTAFQHCSSEQEFDKWLHNAGVRLKNWRKKICHHFFCTLPPSR